MHGPGADERDPCTQERDAIEQAPMGADAVDVFIADDSSLEGLVAQLEQDPDQCRGAFEGLVSLEQETRLRIIRGLRDVPTGPGVVNLLRLLKDAEDGETRDLSRAVLEEFGGASDPEAPVADGVAGEPGIRTGPARELMPARDRDFPRPVRGLITAVDGSGRGTVVVSSTLGEDRRTAAFLCDLLSGIVDVVGTVEDESPGAGRLLEEVRARPEVDAIESPPELASGLLAGCLTLNEPTAPALVGSWLVATLGPGFRPRPFPGPADVPAWDGEPDLQARVGELLDACPSWLDDSPLTIELAEEIYLREGRITASPERDAGAFRFLFEHRILHRLELYRRMLLWMAWFWTSGGRPELAASARILGSQLADEQYAVPSHPFATVLSARSLEAAQKRIS